VTAPRWRVWVDTGGTFTDCLGIDPDGHLHRAKVLSSSALRGRIAGPANARAVEVDARWELPHDFFAGCVFSLVGDRTVGVPVAGWDADSGTIALTADAPRGTAVGRGFELRSNEEAPVLGARLLTRTPCGRPLPPMAMRLATTRGTNALLQRRGAPVALFITAGFGDLLLIGTQQRPDLFALAVDKPAPLFAAVVEVDERLSAEGGVLRAPDLEALRTAAEKLLERGISCAAVALMHAYRNPAHERAVSDLLYEIGFAHVSSSARLAPFIRLVPRAETAVVDATLAPVISGYLARVSEALGGVGTLHVMTSAGGLVRARDYRAKDSLLSGPAGGVVGAAWSGERSGFTRVISFDMGGTSTDVARFEGDFEYLFEHHVGDAHLVAPALAVETVAAGGGSVCRFDGRRLLVGPESAGADPGPACYGAGGPLTVTDVNLLLGRLNPDRFEIPIDPAAARRAADELVAAVGDTGLEAVLEGLLDIANERMADAIRRISLRQGYDPADHALVAFGGAGAQHACAVARLLGMRTVVVPVDAGLLSALGLGRAVVERFSERQVLRPLDAVQDGLDGLLSELAREASAAVAGEGVAAEEVVVRRRILNMRFLGQDSALAVDHDPGVPPATSFHRAYESLYGYRPEEREVELESVRVVASSRPDPLSTMVPTPVTATATARLRRCFVAGCWQEIGVHERAELAPGVEFVGPALVLERHSAAVVEPGWRARVDASGALVLRTGGEDG